MKKQILFFAILAFFGVAHATIYTVDNNLNSGAMFTSLPAAIDSADAGDTILVSGSGTDYENIMINKKLILIGAGYNPNNQSGQPSKIDQVIIDSLVGISSARGSIITGFLINALVGGNIRLTADITLERNRIDNIYFYQVEGWMIRHNIIRIVSHQGSNVSSLLIMNNIFRASWNLDSWENNNSSTIIFCNNIFTANSGTIYNSSYCKDLTFNNNIFYGVSPYEEDNINCHWNNNISYSTANDTFYITNGNTGSGNMINTDPQFEDVSGETFEYAYDYHLQSGSPGEDAGLDGTDIGIYGTNYPMPGEAEIPWQTSAMPKIPQIIEANVKNPTIPINGTLQVQIKARKND